MPAQHSVELGGGQQDQCEWDQERYPEARTLALSLRGKGS